MMIYSAGSRMLSLTSRTLSTGMLTMTRSMCSSNLESAQLTLKVRNEIKKKSDQAKLGGGQKRIDAQHKKVKKCLLMSRRCLFLIMRYCSRGSWPPANGLICCVTPEHSWSMTCSWSTPAGTSAWRMKNTPAIQSLQVRYYFSHSSYFF